PTVMPPSPPPLPPTTSVSCSPRRPTDGGDCWPPPSQTRGRDALIMTSGRGRSNARNPDTLQFLLQVPRVPQVLPHPPDKVDPLLLDAFGPALLLSEHGVPISAGVAAGVGVFPPTVELAGQPEPGPPE